MLKNDGYASRAVDGIHKTLTEIAKNKEILGMVSQRDRMQSPEKRMVNIPPFHWTVLDEKIFLRGVIDRLQHRSSTLGRFGAPEVFVEQYLAGLNQRCVGFDGTK
jgi:hypothetical protein